MAGASQGRRSARTSRGWAAPSTGAGRLLGHDQRDSTDPWPRVHEAGGGLTGREWEILRLLASGATNSQIASALVVSDNTVKSHIKRILRKLPAANRAEAVYRYTQLAGPVSPGQLSRVS